jgi:hypothetical protein
MRAMATRIVNDLQPTLAAAPASVPVRPETAAAPQQPPRYLQRTTGDWYLLTGTDAEKRQELIDCISSSASLSADNVDAFGR